MTVEGYVAAQAAFIARNAQALPGRYAAVHPHEVARALEAYINHGRWLVDCPCGNGVMTAPGWPACCYSCGAIYRDVHISADADQIEALLSRRPIAHQNWKAGESLALLRAENVQHGISEEG